MLLALGERRHLAEIVGFETRDGPERDILGEPLVVGEEIALPAGGHPPVDVHLKVVDQDGAGRVLTPMIRRARQQSSTLSSVPCEDEVITASKRSNSE